MSLKEVCRACLCAGRTMSSLLESIVPKFDSPPDSVLDLWKIFTKVLITHEDYFPDKICMECLDEIEQTYSFMLKCNRSNDTLKKMKNAKIYLRKLETVSVSRENDSWKNARISSGKDSEQFKVYIEAQYCQADPQSLDPLIVQLKDDNLENDLLDYRHSENVVKKDNVSFLRDIKQEHTLDKDMCNESEDYLGIDLLDLLDNEDDARKVEVSCIQDIKHEPELNISMEDDVIDGIAYEDESSIDNLKCPGCNYECQMKENLTKHLIENHMEENMCKLCNKEFKCATIKHCFIHLDAIQVIPESTNMKRYKCKICSKIFQRKSNLKRHLVLHTAERLFKCEICQKAFQHKSILMDHLRWHTGPFKCEICRKTFQQKENFTYHLRCHTREGRFKCQSCPKAFSDKRFLNEHLKLHMTEEKGIA